VTQQNELDQILAELYGRQPEQHIRPRLEPTARLVGLMGDPQKNYGIIHITGTNGKTSTSRIIERILREHGLRTGRLTSPHLVNFNERIALDGDPVSDEMLVETYRDNKPLLDLVDQQLIAEGHQPLTFFEAFTALAFQLFSDAPVDVLVLEVGMGGEWDATNVADADVAVFTSIDLDHQKSLGNTVEEIATTKAGIIKAESLVVSSPQYAGVVEVLEANSQGLKLSGRDFQYGDVSNDGFGTRFSVRGLAGDYPQVWMPIIGFHQAQNAATAIAAVELFLGEGSRPIADEVLRAALADALSPGRLQVVSKDPLVVLDGAHNPAGMASLTAALDESFNSPKTLGLVAMLADKDLSGTIAEMAKAFDQVICTQPASPRGLPASELAQICEDLGIQVLAVEPSVIEAYKLANRLAAEEKAALFVTGSLYLIGDVLKYIQDQRLDDEDEE
jgi:dihydrofolate synthase / folylpolyglutamate synthase